ncbi:OmpA family protein [Candidatus Babeliales bacterium]|nr:OmpA family protein [Candidatus Babeliales bacterium]
MRNFGAFVLLITLFFSGCGKEKKSVSNKNSEMAMQKYQTSRARGQIDEYVFEDNSKVEEFDFVTEDQKVKTPKKEAYSSETDVAEELLEEELGGETLAFSESKDDEDGFERVQFEFNTDRLHKGQEEKLHKNIEVARKIASKENNVDVRAYCCEMGAADYNLALSQKRANVIRQEMINHGISPSKVTAVGRGQEYQVAWSNANDRVVRIKELSPNRRAEFSITPNN